MEITIPHNFNPRSYQLDLLKSPQRFKIAVFNRRAGKSKTALNQQIIRSQLKKGLYYYFLPTYRLAKDAVWDTLVPEHIPQEIIERKLEAPAMTIYFKNGSIWKLAGAENPDGHRGINPVDVVFDEYSEMNEEIWTAIIQPILQENQGTATFIFTPKGKNHSWKLIEQARDNPKDWYVSIKGVYDTKSHSDEALEEVRRTTPQALYNQEYLCEFNEAAGQFFRRIKENTYDPAAIPLPTEGKFQLGVDFAKYQDWTVITPFHLNHFIVYPQDRFNQVDWNLQKARVQIAAFKHNNALVWPDSTGLGDPLVEDLVSMGVDIGDEGKGFKFTEQSRRQLLDNLAILLEQDRIKIPNDPGLIGELEAFRYELTTNGKIRVGVPSGMTDDRVMSLALSVWGVKEPLREDPFTLNRIAQNRSAIKSFR